MDISRFLNQTVTIQTSTDTRNSVGEFVKSWTTSATVTGALRLLSSTDQIRAGKDNVVSTHRLYIEPATITKDDQVIIDGTTYEIIYVNEMQEPGHFYQIDLRVAE
jgi:SPP1 family predicted phage head-tail adaptor